MNKKNKLCARNYNDINKRYRKPYSARTAGYISNNIAKRNVFNKYISNYEVKVVISFYDFAEKLKYNINDFIQELNLIKKYYKSKFNYFQDANFFRFSNIYGTEFSFTIIHEKYAEKDIYVLSVWDYTGNTLIFSSKIPDTDRKSFFNKLEKACDEFSNGFINCIGCGKLIPFAANQSQRYYGGIFCKSCWDNKWKDIEEKEDYR